MISHVPGPFERLIRRAGNRIEAWLDGILADPKPIAAQVAHRAQIRPIQAPPARLEPHEPKVAHSANPGDVAAREPEKAPVAPRVAPTRGRDLLTKIAKAIEDGRAAGSQREIARTFNVSRATVQRAQKLVRELESA